ncbi:unnamed protein product [Durusdinium trenchii]|uniref:Uncharacterized protein n=1 Tax=Durusdinium trenchii TaxID=1381693 RepID=A0ABP0KHG6_9DINO
MNGRSLLEAIWNTYQVGDKQRIKFFADCNEVGQNQVPYAQRVRNIGRHPCNCRQQSGVKATYVASCKHKGIVEGVRGEPWLVTPTPDVLGEKKGPFLVDNALQIWKKDQGITWSTKGYESKCADFIRQHQEFNEVPLLEDNVEESWVFDTVSKKHLFSRMWTIMNGSVVTFGSGPSTGTKRSGKENQQPKKRAKAKAKAGAGGGSANAGSVLASIQMPEEKDLTATTIKCEVGVRSKLWIDDLLQCIRHSVDSLKKLLRGDADSFDFDSLRSRMLRLGLLFCFTGTVKVSTARGCKAHKKWSGLRAALKEYALWQVVQVGVET